MEKVKSNASWNELSSEQLATLDKWLFEDKLSYTELLTRAQAELGFSGSRSSLQRYYQRRKKEKKVEEIEEVKHYVAQMSGAGSDLGALRTANMKLLGSYLFQALTEGPEKLKELTPTINVMVQNDHNEAWRELKSEEYRLRREFKAEDQRLRQQAMAFAKEKFHFDTIEAAMKILPRLRELEEARKDPGLKHYEENAMINKLRREAFGVVWEGYPESAKEEEEMLAAMKERQAQTKREEEAQKNRERITEPEPLTPSSPHYEEYLEWKAQEEKENEQAPEETLNTKQQVHGEPQEPNTE